MKVRNKNHPLGSVIAPGGKVYNGDAYGVFEVPQDFGNWLCGTPGWEPASGASLGDVVARPAGMSEEAHAKAVVSAEEKKRKELEAKKAAEAEAAKKAEEEDQRADTAEPQSLDGTNAAKPEASEEKADDEGGPVLEGPDLDGKTKDELIEIGNEWAAKGYDIDVSLSMKKAEIRKAIETALYGSDEE